MKCELRGCCNNYRNNDKSVKITIQYKMVFASICRYGKITWLFGGKGLRRKKHLAEVIKIKKYLAVQGQINTTHESII